ncbi:MAG: serine/threonine protein kinase, partial [Gemmatimonadetes bacterium]|nr:serine/threonine protein kinase [Gemmatimonadota bacterium]
GQYRLGRRLGEGGMGIVYLAGHRMLARPAAIKVIRPDPKRRDAASRRRTLRQFEREAKATAALHSPHTIQVYDFGTTEDGEFYYVMELLDGLDLETLVRQNGPIEPARACHILIQACESLAEAHAVGLVHRDIKPANIYLCRQGLEYDFVKVLDFGLVGLDSSRRNQQSTQEMGSFQGTPAYCSPETTTRAKADGRSDLYSLGCVAYWLLTGRVAFRAETALATVLAHLEDRPPPPSQMAELEIPEELDSIVMWCLERAPSDRPQSAARLVQRLKAYAAREGWSQDRAAEWWAIHRPATTASPTPSHLGSPIRQPG